MATTNYAKFVGWPYGADLSVVRSSGGSRGLEYPILLPDRCPGHLWSWITASWIVYGDLNNAILNSFGYLLKYLVSFGTNRFGFEKSCSELNKLEYYKVIYVVLFSKTFKHINTYYWKIFYHTKKLFLILVFLTLFLNIDLQLILF